MRVFSFVYTRMLLPEKATVRPEKEYSNFAKCAYTLLAFCFQFHKDFSCKKWFFKFNFEAQPACDS